MLCPPQGCLLGVHPSSQLAGHRALPSGTEGAACLGLRAPGIPSSAVGRLRGVGKSRANGWEGEEKSLRVAPSPSRLPQGDLDPLPSVPGPKVSAGPRSTSWEVSPRFPTSWGTPGLEGPNTPPALQTRGGHGAPGPVWGRRGPETKLKADPRPQANWHFRPHLSCMGGGAVFRRKGLGEALFFLEVRRRAPARSHCLRAPGCLWGRHSCPLPARP